MKKIFTCTIAALLVTSVCTFASPNESKLMEREKAAWQAFKDKDAAAFKKIVGPEMVGLYDDGVSDLAKEIADMQKWDMRSFELSDYKTTSERPSVVVSTYVVKIEGTYNGKKASATYNCGSVWQKHNGEWRATFHTNVRPMTSS